MIPLTPREKEALLLVGEGYTNAEIGRRMGIATRSVANALEKIRHKAGLPGNNRVYNNRARLIRLADRVKADEKSELAGLRWLGKASA